MRLLRYRRALAERRHRMPYPYDWRVRSGEARPAILPRNASNGLRLSPLSPILRRHNGCVGTGMCRFHHVRAATEPAVRVEIKHDNTRCRTCGARARARAAISSRSPSSDARRLVRTIASAIAVMAFCRWMFARIDTRAPTYRGPGFLRAQSLFALGISLAEDSGLVQEDRP